MSNWEKTMKEWDDSIPDGIKYLSAENRVLTRKVRELESENDALQARAEKAEEMVERLMRGANSVTNGMEFIPTGNPQTDTKQGRCPKTKGVRDESNYSQSQI